MPDIHHHLDIGAPPERVYAALTTEAGVRGWWTRDAELDAAVGGRGTFRFYDGKTVTVVRIDELAPPSRVRWTTLSSHAPGGWADTTIVFEATPHAAGSALSFAHRGFARANESFARVNTGWAYYLVSLKQYLERGRGAPHPDVDFARMIA